MSTRGKVIDLATGSLKKATEEMSSVKTSMVQEIREVKNKLSEGKSGEGKNEKHGLLSNIPSVSERFAYLENYWGEIGKFDLIF